jgi:hypothetical protein
MMKPLACMVGVLMLLGVSNIPAHDIIRHAAPNFPISSSVVVPAGTELVFLSGVLADAADEKAPAGSIVRLGDTAALAKCVLAKIQK